MRAKSSLYRQPVNRRLRPVRQGPWHGLGCLDELRDAILAGQFRDPMLGFIDLAERRAQRRDLSLSEVLHAGHAGSPHQLGPLATEALDSDEVRHRAPVAHRVFVEIDTLAHASDTIIGRAQFEQLLGRIDPVFPKPFAEAFADSFDRLDRRTFFARRELRLERRDSLLRTPLSHYSS